MPEVISSASNTLQTPGTVVTDKLVFSHFPDFALFIRDNHLIPYIQEQIDISREINLPMLRFFEGMTDEQLIAMSTESHALFLTVVSENKLKSHLEQSLKTWVEDGLGIIKRDEITAEDITLSSYYRKKALLKFLPLYTGDVNTAIEIIKEIDIYAVESDTAATNIYINLLRDRINEQVHFSERISNTTPGLNYVLELTDWKLKYGNRNYLDFFGHTLEEMQAEGNTIAADRMHPDNRSEISEYLERCNTAADGEVISWEYRLQNKFGDYVWMRNYTSVFKRDATGKVTKVVGLILDVDKEKRASEKLVESEKYLRKANEIALIGNWAWDLSTGKIEWTDTLYKIYGILTGTALSFDDILACSHPEDREKTKERLALCLKTLQPVESTYRITLADGTKKILYARSEAFADPSGKAYKVIGAIQDITERQQLIEQLQLSDKLFKQAQTLTHIGNWTWDIPTNKVTWSDEMYRIYGLEPQSEEVSYETYLAHIHPEDRKKRVKEVQHVFETGIAEDHHYRILLPDGSVRILHTKSEIHYGEDGSPLRMTGTCQDVTEQKLAEKQLLEYQAFINKIMDVTPSIIASYNINTGKYSFINEAIEKLLGYPVSRIMDEGAAFLISIVHPDDLPVIMEKNAKALEEANKQAGNKNELVAEFKYRLRNASGEYRWFHTYGTIFERNSNGLVESVLNISVDITEQEAAEQALSEKNAQLEQSNTSLEEYAYIASHDLKEPLRKITTFSDRLLISQPTLNEDGKMYLTKIIDSSKRMQKMIHDLLTVSTISGNKSFEVCNLNELLSEVLHVLDHKIEEHKVIIETDDLPSVSVVRSQFVQLFQNLIGNSLKFIRKDIQPRIKITHKKLNSNAAEHFKLPKNKKYLQIDIEDNGIGFDDEYATKIFGIFQRLHGKSEYEGSGIGLTVCKKIATNHEGIIFAKSAIDEGATFTVIIPV